MVDGALEGTVRGWSHHLSVGSGHAGRRGYLGIITVGAWALAGIDLVLDERYVDAGWQPAHRNAVGSIAFCFQAQVGP